MTIAINLPEVKESKGNLIDWEIDFHEELVYLTGDDRDLTVSFEGVSFFIEESQLAAPYEITKQITQVIDDYTCAGGGDVVLYSKPVSYTDIDIVALLGDLQAGLISDAFLTDLLNTRDKY